MPDMDGYQVCRALKADEVTREIPIVFVTAQNDPAEEARGLDEGAVDFIAKPLLPKWCWRACAPNLRCKRRRSACGRWPCSTA
jgi:CheY-like chemotaxis protein